MEASETASVAAAAAAMEGVVYLWLRERVEGREMWEGLKRESEERLWNESEEEYLTVVVVEFIRSREDSIWLTSDSREARNKERENVCGDESVRIDLFFKSCDQH